MRRQFLMKQQSQRTQSNPQNSKQNIALWKKNDHRLDEATGKRKSTLQIFNSYKINEYKLPSPSKKASTSKVTFDRGVSVDKDSRRQSSFRQHLFPSETSMEVSARSPRPTVQRIDISQATLHPEYGVSPVPSPRRSERNSQAHHRSGQISFNLAHEGGRNDSTHKVSTHDTATIFIEQVNDETHNSQEQDQQVTDDDDEDADLTPTRRIKRLPGETKQQAIERIERQKEIRRIEKLMKFAFPRQRETHIYKKKLLQPDELNMSVDLIKLKQESMRLEEQRRLQQTLTKETADFRNGSNFNFSQLSSGQVLPRAGQLEQSVVASGPRAEIAANTAFNSVSTLKGQKGTSEMILAESSIETKYEHDGLGDQSLNAFNLNSEESLMYPSVDEGGQSPTNAEAHLVQQMNGSFTIKATVDMRTSLHKDSFSLENLKQAEIEVAADGQAGDKPKNVTTTHQSSKGSSRVNFRDSATGKEISQAVSQQKQGLPQGYSANVMRSRFSLQKSQQQKKSQSPQKIAALDAAKKKEMIMRDVIRMQSNISNVLMNFSESFRSNNGRQLSPLAKTQTFTPFVMVQDSQGRMKRQISPTYIPKLPVNANVRIPAVESMQRRRTSQSKASNSMQQQHPTAQSSKGTMSRLPLKFPFTSVTS